MAVAVFMDCDVQAACIVLVLIKSHIPPFQAA